MAEGLFYTAGVSGGMCAYVEKVKESGGSRVLTSPILIQALTCTPAGVYTERAAGGAVQPELTV